MNTPEVFDLRSRMWADEYHMTVLTPRETANGYHHRLGADLPSDARLLANFSASDGSGRLVVRVPACLAGHLSGRYQRIASAVHLNLIVRTQDPGRCFVRYADDLHVEEGMRLMRGLSNPETHLTHLDDFIRSRASRRDNRRLNQSVRARGAVYFDARMDAAPMRVRIAYGVRNR